MKKIIISISVILVSLGLSAQNTGANFLTDSPDAQAVAMGGASVAMEADAYSFWNNPAAVSFSERKMAVGVSYGLMQPQLSKANMASVAGFGKITDKLSIEAAGKFYMHKPYDLVNSEGMYDGTFTPMEFTVGVGAAYQILPCLSAGLGLNYISSDIGGPKTASAFSANVGVFFQMKGFSAGLRASNLGTSVNYGGETSYPLPMDIALGAGYKVGKADKHNLDINAQVSMIPANSAINAAAGLRYNYARYFHIAAGYSYAIDKTAPSFLTLGAGVEFIGISIDACYIIGSMLGNTLMFNLGYAF